MKNTRTLAALFAVATAFAATAATAQTTPAQDQLVAPITQQAQGKSRAEVVAELNLWRRAGLDGLEITDMSYEHNVAEYQRLRSGPAYLAEVHKLGGDTSMLAGEPAKNQAQ